MFVSIALRFLFVCCLGFWFNCYLVWYVIIWCIYAVIKFVVVCWWWLVCLDVILLFFIWFVWIWMVCVLVLLCWLFWTIRGCLVWDCFGCLCFNSVVWSTVSFVMSCLLFKLRDSVVLWFGLHKYCYYLIYWFGLIVHALLAGLGIWFSRFVLICYLSCVIMLFV